MGGQAIWVGVAAVLVGVGGGVAVMHGKRDADAAAGGAPRVAEAGADEVGALGDELRDARRSIAALEKELESVSRSVADARAENARLRRQVEGLASAQGAAAAPAPRPAAAAGTNESVLAPAPAPGGLPAPLTDPATGLAVPYGTSMDAREVEVRGVLAKIEAEKKAEERAREQKRTVDQARRRVAELADRLALSPDQSEKFAQAMVERDETQGQMWQKAREEDLPREVMRAQGEAVQKAYDEKLQAVLSPAQYAELQKYREEQQQGGPGGGNRPPGGPGGGGRRGQGQ